MSDSGAIVGTASYTPTGTADPIPAGPHGVMLLPFKLVNLADPYRGTPTNPGHNNQDTPIDLSSTTNGSDINGIAWIAAHDPNNVDQASGVPMPRMPELQASIAAPSGCQVLWKLQVTFHDRNGNPHRDFDTGDPNNANTSAYLMTDPIVSPGS